MRKSIILASLFAMLTISSCDYLDVVPTEIPVLQDAFKDKPSAERFLLGGIYGYIPVESSIANNPAHLSTDQLDIPWRNDKSNFLAYHINLGTLDAASPYYDLMNLYKGSREAYLFLQNIDKVPGVEEDIRQRWKAEANYLIGYFHFCLFRQYGPIILSRGITEMDAPDNEIFAKRRPVDECVAFILEKINYAIANGLPDRIETPADYGRITTLIAQSMKARVLLYHASPLFNGNANYANFANSDGEKLFPETFSNQKWEAAADAALAAINQAHATNIALYNCGTNSTLTFADPAALTRATNTTGITPVNNKFVNYNQLSAEKQREYDYRYSMVDPWNCELIWGFTNIEGNQTWQRHSMLRPYVFNGMSPTLKMVETYYTKNGLPIDEDPAFDYDNRYQLVAANQTGEVTTESTPKLHLDREPRFYASVAFDGSVYELRSSNIVCEVRKNKAYGKQTQDASSTGYLVKKGVHPKSDSKGNGQTKDIIKYPFPTIRLAELYLNYAEALNECEGSKRNVDIIISYLDKIRERSGVPGVRQAWAKAKHPITSFSKDELRKIIHTERNIELSYEGHRMWDVRRWQELKQEFDGPIYGWNVDGTTSESFYNTSTDNVATPKVVGEHNIPSEYYGLWPISTSELQKNSSLVQTKGW
ncbi:MAG: RagB/SusD family nutrient uptake outer membrane protein [Bacteroides sp.]